MENETGKKEINGYIQELRAKGCKNMILQLAAEDLEYGLTKDQIERYALKNWKFERIQMFSKALRTTGDEDFLSMLENGNFSAEQMEVLLRFLEKGMSGKQIESVADCDMKPHAIQKALQKVYEAAKQTEKAAEKEPYFVRQVQERIQNMVDGIGANKDFLMAVMEKLDSLDRLQQGNDDVRASLAAVIEQKDRELEEQQKSNNKLAVECAELRTKYSAILEKQDAFADEKADLEKQIEILQAQIAKQTENVMVSEETTKTAGISGDTDYYVPVKGNRRTLRVERTVSGRQERLLALAGLKFFKGKSKVNLIKQLTGKGLNQAQMEQVKVAVQSGLNEQEVIDIINSGFDAEEMAQAIEIVMADKMYQ